MQSCGLPHHRELVSFSAGFILDHEWPFQTSVNCGSSTMQNDLSGQEMASGVFIKGMLTSRQERLFHITDWRELIPTHRNRRGQAITNTFFGAWVPAASVSRST